jgi:hypothetical protein
LVTSLLLLGEEFWARNLGVRSKDTRSVIRKCVREIAPEGIDWYSGERVDEAEKWSSK